MKTIVILTIAMALVVLIVATATATAAASGLGDLCPGSPTGRCEKTPTPRLCNTPTGRCENTPTDLVESGAGDLPECTMFTCNDWPALRSSETKERPHRLPPEPTPTINKTLGGMAPSRVYKSLAGAVAKIP